MNCKPIKYILRYHKIDSYATHTLTTRKNRFSKIFFLCSPKIFGGAYSRRLVRPSVSPPVSPYVPNRVRPITSLFKSDFKTFSKEWSPYWDDVSRANFGCYLEGQGHSMTFQQNRVQTMTSLVKVGFFFYRNDHHIETTWGVQMWAATWTLKVKVTTWPLSINVSGPLLRYLKSDFKHISQKLSPY